MNAPPFYKEAEDAIIASCLMREESISEIISILNHKDFYSQDNRDIFESIEKLFTTGKSVDIVTVMNDLKESGKKFDARYISELLELPISRSKMDSHCNIIKEKSKARQLIPACNEAIAGCKEGLPIGDVLENLGKSFFEISAGNEEKTFTMGEAVDSLDKITLKRFKAKSSIVGIPTGFIDIDRRLGGLQAPSLIILAGRPSMGKSMLALNIAENSAMDGFKWAVFSMEMSKEQLALRTQSRLAKIDSMALNRGRISDEDWPKLVRASSMMNKMGIIIDETPALTIAQFRAKAKMYHAKYGINGIVVDYLQLMRGTAERKDIEIGDITGGMKQTCKELDIPIILLSQLNRNVESRTDKRPMMSDLKESSAIEQDADVIGFIYRDEVYNKSHDNPEKGKAELNFAKIRMGDPGRVDMLFDGSLSCFKNLVDF